MTQRIDKQIGPPPAIETKLHLFEIGREMLCTESVPCSHDAAFEKRESGFDGIGVNIPHDIDTTAVLNRLVVFVSGLLDGYGVSGCVIRHNHVHILADIFANEFRERSCLCITGMKEAQIAIALANAEHYFFVIHAGDAALSFVHATDVGSVHFHYAIQQWLIRLRHGVADAVTEVPCGLVAHSDRALNLAGRHPFLGFAEQVRSEKPLSKRQVRIVEHGSRSRRELVVTILAVEKLLFSFKLDHWAFAAQASRAFRPAETDQQFAALIFGAKESVYIN